MRRVVVGFVCVSSIVLSVFAFRIYQIAPASIAATSNKYLLDRYDYAGLIHSHTGFSGDAFGSYDDIAKAAAQQDVAFVVSTEHNNIDATNQGLEGWRNGVLMLSGVESSRPEGYLLGLGIKHYAINRHDPTDGFIADVVRQGGLMIVAHPTRPGWRWTGPVDPRFDGMEIMDLADLFYSAPFSQKLMAFLMYPFSRASAYLEFADGSAAARTDWDSITRTRRFVGTYGPDFHQSIGVAGSLKLHWPPAGEVMRFARDHIVTRTGFSGALEHDSAIVYEAIRQGHLYVGIDMLADTTGFMFAGSRENARAWMGDELGGSGVAEFMVDLPPDAAKVMSPVVHVIRNGEEIVVQRWNGSPFHFSDSRPGTYRVEVQIGVRRFLGGIREVTWIYSNPIYLR